MLTLAENETPTVRTTPRRRRPLVAALALACALALAGSSGRAADGPVDLPVMGPFTGPQGLLGQQAQRGLHVFESYVNKTGGIRGRPLHFVFLDDQAQPQIAVQLLNQLLARGSQVFLGSIGSASCRAMMPIVAERGPVMYCLSPALAPPAGSYVFTALLNASLEMQAAMRYFSGRGLNRLAVLAATDAAGSDADGAILKLLAAPENKALQLVAHERFNPDELSVAAQVSRIKAANPQWLIVWGAPTLLGNAMHSLLDVGFDVPTITVDSIMTYDMMAQLGKIAPPQLYFASAGWGAVGVMKAGPQRTQLVNVLGLLNAANIAPDAWATGSWDAASIVVEALRKVGPDAPAAAIRTWIAGLHDYNGILGPYDFRSGDQRGLGVRDVVIYRWLGDQRDWRPVSQPGGAPLATR
jgi:branched-chain amino acid transport system substrate-binding protein